MSGQKKGSTSFTMHRRDAIYKNLYVDNLKGRKLAITDDISMCPVVIGENASAVSGMSIGCDTLSENSSTAVGNNSKALNSNSTAVGDNASSGTDSGGAAQSSTAVGQNAQAGITTNTQNSTAVGQNAQAGTSAGSYGSTAIGQDTRSGTGNNSYRSVAIGNLALAGVLPNTHDSTALGADSKALTAYATALGSKAEVVSGNGIALGHGAIVQSLATVLGSTNSYIAIGSAAAQVLINNAANCTPSTDRLIVRLNNNQMYGIVLEKLNP